MPEIKVIIAGANPMMRMRIAKAISAGSGASGIKVVGEATDLPETYTKVEAQEPGIVLVARDMTLLPEFALMKALFRAVNARWILADHPGTAGPAPRPTDPAEFAPISSAWSPDEICQSILTASRLAPAPAAPAPPPVTRTATNLRSDKLILIGASTGGIDALLTVLAAMPENCPPIAVVQHTGQGFSESLIRLLSRRCSIRIEPARTGVDLAVGQAIVAAGCPGHMRLHQGRPPRVTVEPGPLISGHSPSVDAMFQSALPMAQNVVAVLLTGMGRDGAEGLLALRRAGAQTIGQDEASSVVYGMPRAAFEIGAVAQQLGLDKIAPAIVKACAGKSDSIRVST